MLTDEEDALIDYLEEKYGCHTVLLFGSRARGTHRADSDWDVFAIHDAERESYAGGHHPQLGKLAIFLFATHMVEFDPHNPSVLYRPREMFVRRMRDARILIERDGLGTAIVETAKRLYERGPPRCPPSYPEHLRYNYFVRLLPLLREERTLPTDCPSIMRDYLRIEAQSEALTQYYYLRQQWEPAPKDAIASIYKNDFQMYDALEYGMKSTASPDELERLFEMVLR